MARFALGRAHLARGEYDRSISDLEAAIELNPGMAQAHCALGDTMAYSGKLDDAITHFENAIFDAVCCLEMRVEIDRLLGYNRPVVGVDE